MAALCRSPWALNLPHLEGPASGPQPQIERSVGKQRTRIPQTQTGVPQTQSLQEQKCGVFKNSPGRPSTLAAPNSSGQSGHILKDVPLPLMRRATMSSPTLWQSDHVSGITSSNPPAAWKNALARWNASAEL